MFYFVKTNTTTNTSTKKISLKFIPLSMTQSQMKRRESQPIKLYCLQKKREKAHSFQKNNQNSIILSEEPIMTSIRRQSCHCSECGQLSKFQNKYMVDCPIKTQQVSHPDVPKVSNFKEQLSRTLHRTFTFVRSPSKRMTCSWELVGIKKNKFTIPTLSLKQLELTSCSSVRLKKISSPKRKIDETAESPLVNIEEKKVKNIAQNKSNQTSTLISPKKPKNFTIRREKTTKSPIQQKFNVSLQTLCNKKKTKLNQFVNSISPKNKCLTLKQ